MKKYVNREELEQELKDDLLWFADNATLPEKYRVEPGAFLYLVSAAWPRDGRSGGLSDMAVAEKITARTGVPLTRNQFLTALTVNERNYKTPVPKAVAAAFMDTAFTHWHSPPTRDGAFLPFGELCPERLSVAKRNAVLAMFRNGGVVFCRRASARAERPWLDIMPILRTLVASDIGELSLLDLTSLIKDIQLAGVERVVTPDLIREMLRVRSYD